MATGLGVATFGGTNGGLPAERGLEGSFVLDVAFDLKKKLWMDCCFPPLLLAFFNPAMALLRFCFSW